MHIDVEAATRLHQVINNLPPALTYTLWLTEIWYGLTQLFCTFMLLVACSTVVFRWSQRIPEQLTTELSGSAFHLFQPVTTK
jgi:hypothetical protein